MYKRILVPVDPNGPPGKAVQHAADLSRALGSQVILMTVAESAAALASEGKRALDGAAGSLRDAGVACETLVYASDKPWEGIAMAAEERQCDLIVMSSSGGQHLDGFVFGSIAAAVLTRSHVPLLVIREDAEA
jgi:nucleotide-binding universal stress UspA family protein